MIAFWAFALLPHFHLQITMGYILLIINHFPLLLAIHTPTSTSSNSLTFSSLYTAALPASQSVTLNGQKFGRDFGAWGYCVFKVFFAGVNKKKNNDKNN